VQQEWLCGISIDPHVSAICLQHSRSSAVMSLRSKQAIAGIDSTKNKLKNAPTFRSDRIDMDIV
jgi:hypothetical protein